MWAVSPPVLDQRKEILETYDPYDDGFTDEDVAEGYLEQFDASWDDIVVAAEELAREYA